MVLAEMWAAGIPEDSKDRSKELLAIKTQDATTVFIERHESLINVLFDN